MIRRPLRNRLVTKLQGFFSVSRLLPKTCLWTSIDTGSTGDHIFLRGLWQEQQSCFPFTGPATSTDASVEADDIWLWKLSKHGDGLLPLLGFLAGTQGWIVSDEIRLERSAVETSDQLQSHFPSSSFLTGADYSVVCDQIRMLNAFKKMEGFLPLTSKATGCNGCAVGDQLGFEGWLHLFQQNQAMLPITCTDGCLGLRSSYPKSFIQKWVSPESTTRYRLCWSCFTHNLQMSNQVTLKETMSRCTWLWSICSNSWKTSCQQRHPLAPEAKEVMAALKVTVSRWTCEVCMSSNSCRAHCQVFDLAQELMAALKLMQSSWSCPT